MAVNKAESSYHIQSVQRAFKILKVIARSRQPLSLAEITREAGFHKSVCHRLLITLADEGAVEQADSSGRYRIGTGLYVIGQSAADQMRLASVALSIVQSLMEQSGESVYLNVESNMARLCIAKAESPHTIRHYVPLGKLLPLGAGAGGKILLAAYTREEFDRYIADVGNVAHGPNAIVDTEKLWEALENVRRQNVAWSWLERTDDGASVGVPIRDHSGAVVASLVISGPASRFTENVPERLLQLVTAAGDDLSRRLGFVPEMVPARWARGRAW